MNPDFNKEYLALYEQDYLNRVRIAFGKGLYPTAWGAGWTPEDWQNSPTSLNQWLDHAMGNVRTVLRS